MAHRRPLKISKADPQVYPHGHLFGEWERSRWQPRRGNFATARQSQLVELVRGELIERLDDLLTAAVPVWEKQFAMPRAMSYSLINAVQMALFPDEFAEDETAAEEIAAVIGQRRALVPADGPIERVGWEALEAYAKELGVELEPEPLPPESAMISGVSFRPDDPGLAGLKRA